MKKLCLMVCLFLLVSISACAETEEADKRVLLIFSYHAEYPWVIEETRGAEDILKKRPVEIERFYLDTKRKTNPEWKEQVTEDAENKINYFKPDLVMVFDDNACELVAKRYIGKTLPIVFCGMNGEPEDYGFPANNITGVVEKYHYEETITLIKRLLPDCKKAAILSDDSPSSQPHVTRIKKTVLPIEISEFYTTNDFDAWKAKVRELQTKVDAIGIFMYHTIREKGGEESLSPEDVLRWTLNNSRLPEFALMDSTVRDGALCGVTQSGYEQGEAAAEMAIKILDGQKPADIPIIMWPEKGNTMINERRANELNIVIPGDILKEVEILH